jgi:ABC-type branched-subunit amino acid transport system permease subunit
LGTGTQTLVASKKLSLAQTGGRLTAAASGLLLLVLLAVPWYEARYEPKISGLDISNFGGESSKRITAKAWDASLIGKVAVAVAVAVVLAAAIGLFAPRLKLPVRAPVALVVFGAVCAALVMLGIMTDPRFAPAPETFTGIPELDAVKFVYHADNEIGIYLSFGLAVAVSIAGVIWWVGSRAGARPRSSVPPPPPPPS